MSRAEDRIDLEVRLICYALDLYWRRQSGRGRHSSYGVSAGPLCAAMEKIGNTPPGELHSAITRRLHRAGFVYCKPTKIVGEMWKCKLTGMVWDPVRFQWTSQRSYLLTRPDEADAEYFNSLKKDKDDE